MMGARLGISLGGAVAMGCGGGDGSSTATPGYLVGTWFACEDAGCDGPMLPGAPNAPLGGRRVSAAAFALSPSLTGGNSLVSASIRSERTVEDWPLATPRGDVAAFDWTIEPSGDLTMVSVEFPSDLPIEALVFAESSEIMRLADGRTDHYFRRYPELPELGPAVLAGRTASLDFGHVNSGLDSRRLGVFASFNASGDGYVALVATLNEDEPSRVELTGLQTYPFTWILNDSFESHAVLVCAGIGRWALDRTGRVELAIDGPSRIMPSLFTYSLEEVLHFGTLRTTTGFLNTYPSLRHVFLDFENVVARRPEATPQSACAELGVPAEGASVLEPETW